MIFRTYHILLTVEYGDENNVIPDSRMEELLQDIELPPGVTSKIAYHTINEVALEL